MIKQNDEDYLYTTRLGVIVLFVFLILVFLGSVSQNEQELIKPKYRIEEVKAEEPPVEILSEEEQIENYIRFKFGSHYDKAMMLLVGKSKTSCAENRSLDPKAYNHNWSETPGIYWSTDRGLFMINDKFHPSVSDECAYDFKCATNYAYKLFKENGNSFKLWTAGRCLGI